MPAETLEVVTTAVVHADSDIAARIACHRLAQGAGGRVITTHDCSDEDPGCWSVTMSSSWPVTIDTADSASLSAAVRGFVRNLGVDPQLAAVSCAPPTAWTVLDGDELVNRIVPGGERILVEAWWGQNSQQEIASNRAQPVAQQTAQWLRLFVDVASDEPAEAESRAQAVANRITVESQLIDSGVCGPGVIGIEFDLGQMMASTETALATAVQALGLAGWSPLEWEDEIVLTRWTAKPDSTDGILALQLSAGPAITTVHN